MPFARHLLALLLLFATAKAHDGLDLPPPVSAAEAWNVLTMCHANLQTLLGEQRWSEMTIQVSLSIQAARHLREALGPQPENDAGRARLVAVETIGLVLAKACLALDAVRIPTDAATYTAALKQAESGYDPAIVRSPIFSCPMCKGIRELSQAKPCFKCGMALVPRPIPASSLYNTPGEPSITLAATLDTPLRAGQPSAVKVRFTRKKDGAPVTHDDLLLVHTERIHLLIIDEDLGDYHHEHPVPTETPGEFAFSLTPRRAGPYRIFADIVPRLSNVQEYLVCDLPAAAPAGPPADRAVTATTVVGGLRFELKIYPLGLPLRAKQPAKASVTVTTETGQPFTQLEPVMGTFAHIVGFHEDRTTVLHLHPSGGVEPQTPEDRGGPAFSFLFYPPKAGFLRLYAQVQIGGKQVFAPFGVLIQP